MVIGLALGASYLDFRLFAVPWVAVAALIALAEGAPPRRAFGLGLLAGAAGIALAFNWLVYTFRVFGGFSNALAVAIYLATVAWMALEFALFTGLVAWIGPLPLGLTAPLAFTAVEFLFPALFPWRLAHSQYRLPVLLQSGDVAGPFLLTFTMVWMSTGLLAAVRHLATDRDHRRASAALAAPTLLLAAVLAYGAWRLADVRAARAAAPALRVGIVQGNVDIAHKSDPRLFAQSLADYRALSRRVAADVDLLVWPETVVFRPIASDRDSLTGAESPFPDPPRPLLFGALALTRGTDGPRLANSAFLLRQDGALAGRYDKRVLMPFGEYMPLGDRFPRLRALSPATADLAPGRDQTPLSLSASARIGVLICYEDLVPASARAAVDAGATVLVNLTNDAWYGRSAAPEQHQALALWRTVETRRDLVRATNTGLTSLIAATGEVLAELPTFEARTLAADVRLLTGRTVYTRTGNVFGWSIVTALVVVLLLRRRCRLRGCR